MSSRSASAIIKNRVKELGLDVFTADIGNANAEKDWTQMLVKVVAVALRRMVDRREVIQLDEDMVIKKQDKLGRPYVKRFKQFRLSPDYYKRPTKASEKLAIDLGGWMDVFPHMFTAPKLTGTMRVIRNFTEESKEI